MDGDNLNEGELPLPGVNAGNQVSFDAVTSMLPSQILAEIEGETDPATVDITGWTCDTFTQDNDGNWPLTGTYTFTAVMETGHVLAPDAAALEVPVTLGGGTGYSLDGSITWDGQSNAKASSLGVRPGGTIRITGSNTGGGATLVVDVENITVTSDGQPVTGVCIDNWSNVSLSAITIRDLDLTAQAGESGIAFGSVGPVTLTVEGTCEITGGSNGTKGYSAIGSGHALTVNVGSSSLTARGGIGGDSGSNNGGGGLYSGRDQPLEVNVDGGGSLTVQGGGLGADGMYGNPVTVQNDGVVQVYGAPAGSRGESGIRGTDVTLSGSGRMTIGRAWAGLYLLSASNSCTLTVNSDVAVTGASGKTGGIGVFFYSSGTHRLTGSGTLTVDGAGDGIISNPGTTLDLAFTGKLSITSKGDGLCAFGNLTVSAAPAYLKLQTTEPNSHALVLGYGGADGNLTNSSGIPTELLLSDGPILWPAPLVTVNGGTGGGYYVPGATVDISATVPGGKLFNSWTTQSADVSFANANSADTSFVMPGNDVTVTANFKGAPPAVVSVTDVALDQTTLTLYTNKEPQTATLTAIVQPADATDKTVRWQSSDTAVAAVDGGGHVTALGNGTATITVTTNEGGKQATCVVTVQTYTSSSGGGGSSYTAPDPKNSYTSTGDRISQSVSRYDLQWMINHVKRLTLSCDKASMTFETAALKAILAAVPATVGNITFAAAPADISAFPDAAKLIDSRPVYDFTISYKDGNGKVITATVNFPAGSAAVTLNYTPAAGETTGSLFMVYVDKKGAVTWLDKSSYDSGKVLADALHFSTYGVAYKAPVPVFTDITNHWAKVDIEFVTARGLLTGTGKNTFSPDATMTRGMFVTALGRLAGVDPEKYRTGRFTDVSAGSYYAPYVEWAASKGIVTGTGESAFSPDAAITREQMAVIMQRYSDKLGYALPVAREAEHFADENQITGGMKDAVRAMQQAGIMSGKGGYRFAPKDTAKRAEASAVLHRFVEIVIDRDTAGGWAQNDAGRWLYYENGKPVTGWKQLDGKWYYFDAAGLMQAGGWREIGGKWYYFYPGGVMAVDTKIDGYKVGPDGARKD